MYKRRNANYDIHISHWEAVKILKERGIFDPPTEVIMSKLLDFIPINRIAYETGEKKEYIRRILFYLDHDADQHY